MNLRVREVWHSNMDRAGETARAVAAALPGHPPLRVQQGLGPEDRTKPIARMIRSFNGDLMIVGHEPFLGKLAARLVAGKPKRALLWLDKPSCACLSDVADGEWRVAWMLTRATLAAGMNTDATLRPGDLTGAGEPVPTADDGSDGSDDNTP
jgi:phosphohistidine phosphatase